MMQCDTVHSFRNLSHAVRGCNKTVHTCAQTSRLTCTCYKNPVEKWQVDCEAKFRSVVGSCRLTGCQKALSAGSWAGSQVCVVSSLLVESWMVAKKTPVEQMEEDQGPCFDPGFLDFFAHFICQVPCCSAGPIALASASLLDRDPRNFGTSGFGECGCEGLNYLQRPNLLFPNCGFCFRKDAFGTHSHEYVSSLKRLRILTSSNFFN